jgi:hypothetical protein
MLSAPQLHTVDSRWSRGHRAIGSASKTGCASAGEPLMILRTAVGLLLEGRRMFALTSFGFIRTT